VHIATTAKAGRRQHRTLRITQTSRKENRGKTRKLEQVVFERARVPVGRRDPSLPTTETFGRLIRWIDYVD
jgi:hypothetical protein